MGGVHRLKEIVVRLLGPLLWLPLVLSGQSSEKPSPTIPTEKKVDAYAIYSAVLSPPALSHPDNNQKYLVMELSGFPQEQEPGTCIRPPQPYRAAFEELLADRAELRAAHFRLERAFDITKPYDLITEEQAKQFQGLRNNPNAGTDSVEEFRGAVDIITLGNVYFDRRRTLAAVYTWCWCGSLCAYGTWRVFTKNAKGGWEEQHWVGCMTIAWGRSPQPARVRPVTG
jgi:hypothetical protein